MADPGARDTGIGHSDVLFLYRIDTKGEVIMAYSVRSQQSKGDVCKVSPAFYLK